MSTQDLAENIYPTRSPPVSPTISPPSFNNYNNSNNLSRANSLARLGSELHVIPPPPLSSLSSAPSLTLSYSHNPYPPVTPSNNTNNVNPPPLSPALHTRRGPPPPINTSFTSHTSHTPLPTPLVNSFMTAGNSTPKATNNNINNNPNNGSNNSNNATNSKMIDLKEMSVVRWRTGHAFVIVGAILMVLGFCIGTMTVPVTTCKVPYMSYSYYDNYVPYANMECSSHSSGWYVGSPLLAIGFLCVGFSFYYSWLKVQEMKMAAKYRVAMV